MGWLQEVRQAAAQQVLDSSVDVDVVSPTLILPVEQFEDLLTADSGQESPVFLMMIGELIDSLSGTALIVVATMGAADLHLLQTNPQLSRISTALFDLKPMNRLHLRDVITGPARRLTAGGQRLMVEPALVDRLVNDATGVADQLPLLALTLARLYEDYGSGGELTLAHYVAMGGMGRAVQNEIDDILVTDPAERQQQLKTLRAAFIPWLAGIDPDTEQPVRRLARVDDLPAASHDLIDALVKKQLLVKHGHDGQAVVEVALQSLLRLWDDLAAWLQREHEGVEDANKLEGAAQEWRNNDRNPAWLLEGTRLQEAEELACKPRFEYRLRTSSDYLQASRQREDHRIQAEREAAQKLAAAEARADELERTTAARFSWRRLGGFRRRRSSRTGGQA